MDLLLNAYAFFAQGGPAMYLILFCSFISLTIIAERWMYYREITALPDEFLNSFEKLIIQNDFAKAIELCQSTKSIAAQTAIPGLHHMKKNGANLERILESEASLSVAGLRHNLNHLESIVTAAPLLGLLGTVMGMIDSFQILNLKNGQSLAITGGIGEALIATAFGLCTALIAMAAYSYFSHRMEKRITEMEQVFAVLIRNIA